MQGLYRGLTGGHTCLPEKDVRSFLVKLLGKTALAKLALSQAETSTVYRQVNGTVRKLRSFIRELIR